MKTRIFQIFHFPINRDRQIFQSYIVSASTCNYKDPKIHVPFFVGNREKIYILMYEIIQFKALFFPFKGYSPKMILQIFKNPTPLDHFSYKHALSAFHKGSIVLHLANT